MNKMEYFTKRIRFNPKKNLFEYNNQFTDDWYEWVSDFSCFLDLADLNKELFLIKDDLVVKRILKQIKKQEEEAELKIKKELEEEKKNKDRIDKLAKEVGLK